MKKNKKIIIIIISIILILTIAIVSCLYLFKDKEENTSVSENNNDSLETEKIENIEYTYTEDGPAFLCSNQELYTQTLNYDKGDYVYCEIAYELNAELPGIKEIWFETSHDENIEYIEVVDIFEGWKLDSNNGVMHLVTEEPSTYGDGAYKVKFRILPSTQEEKLQISFKNIKFKNVNEEYYQTDDSVIELSINKESNYKYVSSKEQDEIIFYKFNTTNGYEQINKYSCESEICYVYASQCTSYIDLDKGKMFIHDGNKAIFYDFNKGVLGTYSIGVEDLKKYFIVQDIKTEKYGIIDLDGNIIKNFTSVQFGGTKVAPCFNDNTYSLEYDLITEKKDNKYGIVKITKDEIVVNHQFDDIRLYNDKYFKAKVEDKWYLYNLNTSEKVIEDGYKELFIASDEVIVTQIDNYLYIKDYQGNNLIEDKIETFIEYNENACCGNVSGIFVSENNGIIKIYIDEEVDITNYEYKQHQYEYNIKDKKLTKTK